MVMIEVRECDLDDIAQAHVDEDWQLALAAFWVDEHAQAELEEARRMRREGLARLRARLRAEMVEAYGSCAKCGSFEDIQIDHVDGNGGQHRREIGIEAGWNTYAYLKDRGWPKVVDGYRIQPLCRPCHIEKSAAESRARATARRETKADVR